MTQVACASTLSLIALSGIPRVRPGDDVGALIAEALREAGLTLCEGDVLVVTSKLFSRAEGRFVSLSEVVVSAQAETLGREIEKDPRVVELVLQESTHISRKAKHVLVVRHRLGFVSANAGIDLSNARPPGVSAESGPWALLLPSDPDACAARTRATLERHAGVGVGVVVSDSHGRPFRVGTVGVALGVSGLPALYNQVGRSDLDGRQLESTVTALADQVAAAADLVSGQADEARPVVLVRGLSFAPRASRAVDLVRVPAQDLYA